MNEVLSGYSEVNRVPVLELTSHGIQSLLRDVRFDVTISPENIVPNFVSHLLRLDVTNSWRIAVDIGMEEMGDLTY